MKTVGDNRGFTLIEVLVATTISSLLLMMLYGAYQSILSTVVSMSSYSQYYENVQTAIDVINRNLENSYPPGDRDHVNFIGDETGSHSSMSFVTSSGKEVLVGSGFHVPQSGVYESGFFCQEDPGGNGLYFLMHRKDMTPDDETDSGGTSYLLLKNVEQLTFQYRSGNNWNSSWDSRNTKRFPDAVKTTLVVKNYSGISETFVFITSLGKF